MAILYTPNAAAISWLALSQALDSRAAMEGALFQLYADNTKLSVDEAQDQSKSALRQAEDDAHITMTQGMMAMVGAGASGLMTAVSCGMESWNQKQLEKCTTTQTQAKLQEVSEPEEMTASKSLTSEANPLTGETTPNNTGSSEETGKPTAPSSATSNPKDQPSAKVTAKNGATTPATDTSSKTEQSSEDQADENAALQKKYSRNMDFWVQNSNNFSTMANQILNVGISNLLQTGSFGGTNYILDKGKAQAAQALAQGLSTVFNNQSSMLSSALSSCDSYMQNTNSTISTLIQTSAVRG